MEQKFWESRWQEHQTGWDLGHCHRGVQKAVHLALRQSWLNAGEQVLVPGCGRGHEAAFCCQSGLAVDAIDFAPTAIEQAQAAYPQLKEIHWQQADFFSLDAGPFSAVIDRAMFCAIDSTRQSEYIRKIESLLKPQGIWILVLFSEICYPGDANPPPFEVNLEQLKSLAPRLDVLGHWMDLRDTPKPEIIRSETVLIARIHRS